MTSAVVVGAGIAGACATYHLARLGVRVRCLDLGPECGAENTSAGSFARLSAYQQPTEARFRLVAAGIAEHRRLADTLGPAHWWHPGGSLAWGLPGLAEHIGRLRAWGYPVRWTHAAHVESRLDPGVRFTGPRTPVALLPDEGWVDAQALIGALLSEAREVGGATVEVAEAVAIVLRGSRIAGVRCADGRELAADAVVNAAGHGAAALAESAGAPLAPALADRSSLVADLFTRAEPPRHVLRGPALHVRAAGQGLLRVRSEQVDACLAAGAPVDALVEELLARARRMLPRTAEAAVAEARVATAVFPRRGHPCAGAVPAVPGYHELVTNSGITLGPLLGRLVAEELATGQADPLLRDCRPQDARARTYMGRRETESRTALPTPAVPVAAVPQGEDG
ncbi:NAD(P)/FAD-dependent oxidoreductase [Streptomyces iconiensis]|uniref:FAD-dependent oxidoreductase n=1 Tax=Streptomyces iconiensis TaxID=1384038 RepID=A0ABT6ZQC6_9ACTN|nr:FAD-dependent oxidoreductase [Streptomyces iconiensis]MDJ1131256.1 FAD-dependent oxidoreductase [Streptomyces iconiensis]